MARRPDPCKTSPTRRLRHASVPLRRFLTALVACQVLISVTGCLGVGIRETRLRNAISERRERKEALHHLSGETGDVLARHNLVDLAANDPAATALALRRELETRQEPGGDLALAELSYQAGLEWQPRAPQKAIAWYRDAALLSSAALDDRNSPSDAAVTVHNGALARLIRLAQAESKQRNTHWQAVLSAHGIDVNASAPYLDPARIHDVFVATDYRVNGMDHVYRTDGLGVPLVLHRVTSASDSSIPSDEFLPRDFRAGTTAVLRPSGIGDHRATLVLLDPFEPVTLPGGAGQLPLAADRTTPLATQVARGQLATLELMGLLKPGFVREADETGLYMLRPYEPGKIPVVLVHGLFSSPRAWVQTINELRNSPAIAARYQVWVFLYPTGLPIPANAARLRSALVKVREGLDPAHTDAALDRMVLVGHSMGGILSKMMVQETGLALWNAAITVPYDRFKAPPELRKKMTDALVFQPLPMVRRVVFVATPHRGSPLANDLLGRVVSGLVQGPESQIEGLAEIESLNGPNVISRELCGRRLNAVGNLRTDSPILTALDQIPVTPGVPCHSIIPLIGGFASTDGVVEYRSSHLDFVESEHILPGTHFSQEDPNVTRELRRILEEHLAQYGGA